jgi:hypothetical protein
MTKLFPLFVAVLISLFAVQAIQAALDDDSKPKIVITKAVWGSGVKAVDVTKRVAELLHSEANGFSARGEWLKVDPMPYKAKALAIAYDYKGKHYLFVTASTQKVSNELLIENAKVSDAPHPPSDL